MNDGETKEYSRKERSIKTLNRKNAASYYFYPMKRTEETMKVLTLRDMGFRFVPYCQPTEEKIGAFMMKRNSCMDDSYTLNLASMFGTPLIMSALELIDEIGDYDLIMHMAKGNTFSSFKKKGELLSAEITQE